MKYMVSNQEKPHNYPLYSAHSNLDSCNRNNDGDKGQQIIKLEKDTSGPDQGQEIDEAEKKM